MESDGSSKSMLSKEMVNRLGRDTLQTLSLRNQVGEISIWVYQFLVENLFSNVVVIAEGVRSWSYHNHSVVQQVSYPGVGVVVSKKNIRKLRNISVVL
jgi:hypothetical protein